MSWHETPIFIINHNNLDRGFRRLVSWLRERGVASITVIDNHSTYPPLLEFYRHIGLLILHQEQNHGPYVFWNHLKLHESQRTRFVVTDPDVVPATCCPHNLLGKLHEVMDREKPALVKVGPALRIDNLPDHYLRKQEVIEWEKQFWQTPSLEGDAFHAQIDTTFALYEPHAMAWPANTRYLRLAPPYVVEHQPWYEDDGALSAEHAFYRSRAKPEWTHW